MELDIRIDSPNTTHCHVRFTRSAKTLNSLHVYRSTDNVKLYTERGFATKTRAREAARSLERTGLSVAQPTGGLYRPITVAGIALQFPETFGLRSHPGKRFRINLAGSYRSSEYTSLYVQEENGVGLAEFSPEELRAEVTP
jgi:hypothetical protein